MSVDFLDPKLTAYALDELDAADRKRIEGFLNGNPMAQHFVDDVKDLAEELNLHFESSRPKYIAPVVPRVSHASRWVASSLVAAGLTAFLVWPHSRVEEPQPVAEEVTLDSKPRGSILSSLPVSRFESLPNHALVQDTSVEPQISATSFRQDVNDALSNRFQAIQDCMRTIRANPQMYGMVNFGWDVNDSGRAQNFRTVNSQLRSDSLEECVKNQITTIDLPRAPRGRNYQIYYPVNFKVGQ